MINKKIITMAFALFIAQSILSTAVFAQMTEQLEIIDENNVVSSCMQASVFDAMTEQQQENIEVNVCDELEVTTEELALELNEEVTLVTPKVSDEQCLSINDYDVMSDDERAANEIPICDDEYTEQTVEPQKG